MGLRGRGGERSSSATPEPLGPLLGMEKQEVQSPQGISSFQMGLLVTG